jgi:hypothetical protein
MDESVWLEGDSLHQMLEHVRGKLGAARTKAGRRRLRLFSCACVRRIWHLLDEQGRALLEAAELAANGLLSRDEWQRREEEALRRYQANRNAPVSEPHCAVWAALASTGAANMAYGASGSCALALSRADQVERRARRTLDEDHGAFWRIYHEESRRQCGPLMDIFGNPFRPLPARKLPPEVVGLASACGSDPRAYLLLADALEDLGEEQATAHCREGGHVKGCHVVDWALGRG